MGNLVDVNSDPQIEGLLNWQLAKILPVDQHDKERSNSFTGYNFDDIAKCTSESYWKSDWQFVWPKENIYEKYLSLQDVQIVPITNWSHLDNDLVQKELFLTKK